MTLESVGDASLNIGIIIVVGLIVIALSVALVFWIIHLKRYSHFVCTIFGTDGFGNPTQTFDKAGIFTDSKTKNKRFFLKKNNVGLNPDSVPYVLNQKGKKMVYLFQDGLKNFHFLKMDLNKDQMAITVGEEDVNWAINAYERQKKIFSQSMLMQLLPFIALAFTSIIILVMFIYFFKQFPVLKEVAVALKEAALAMQNGQVLQ